MRKLLIITMLAALQGCAWVKLDPAAEQVRVVESQHVEGCKILGKTTVSVKSTVAGFEREEKVMQNELETLARNQAVDLNGDTIVAISPIENGKRTYNVYLCKQAEK